MGTVKVRYLEPRKLKDGTVGYCWHNRHAVAQGLVREWLGTDLHAAITRAEQLNALWDAIRKGEPGAPAPTAGSIAWFARELRSRPEHKGRPDKTRKEVEAALDLVEASPFGRFRLRDVSGDHVAALHKKLAETRSLDLAHRTCKWVRWLLGRAVHAKLIPANPTIGLRLKRPAARQVYWLEEEVDRAIATAIGRGRPSIALAIQLAFDLGQREGDVLRMRAAQYDRGDVVITQGKTGATVRVPALPGLRAELDRLPKDRLFLVLSETTKRPYKLHNFIHLIAETITQAGLTGKRFSDLRRSAVVRLAQAGCTIPEITAITGHSLQRVEQILETYLPRTTPMARAAIEKLLEQRRRDRLKRVSSTT